MSDLASLMQVAPITAAGYMGINQAQQEQMENAKQAELAQLIQSRQGAESRAQQLQPLLMQQHDLQNQETTARIPGVQAQSRSFGLDADQKAGTLQSTIDADNYKNNNAVRQSVFSQLGTYSDSLSKQPAIARHSALDGYITQLGVPDGQKAAMMQHFANVPAEQLPQEVKRISDAAIRSNPEYAKSIDTEKLAAASRENVARILATSRTDVQDLKNEAHAASQIDPKDIEGSLRKQNLKAPPATQLANYNTAIQRAIEVGDINLAMRLNKEAVPIQQQVTQSPGNQPRAGTADVNTLTHGNVPVNPPAQMPLVTPPGMAPSNPTATSGAGPSIDLKSVVEKQGEQYRPDLYEYRVMNGKVQKRPKGG